MVMTVMNSTFMNLIFHLIFRLPQIYEEFYHTVNNADHEKDLKWWSNTYGVNMPMNWPQFEVCTIFFFFAFLEKSHLRRKFRENDFFYKLSLYIYHRTLGNIYLLE